MKNKIHKKYFRKGACLSFSKLLKALCRLNIIQHTIIACCAVSIGFVMNSFDEMHYFHYKALFGLVLYILLFYSLRFMKKSSIELKIELTCDPRLVKCRKKFNSRIKSNANYVLCLIAASYFIAITLLLKFVKLNLIGIYSLIGLFCIVFIAFIIFQQYIYLLLLIYDISLIKVGNYYEIIPERTEWLQAINRISNRYRNLFIILGSLFIFLFILFSPTNTIQILFNVGISSNLFIPLLITWLIILIAIVLMIPLSSYIRNKLVNRIFDNLKEQSLNNYMDSYQKSLSTNKLLYMNIILRIYEQKSKMRDSMSWLTPVIVSAFNISAVAISLVVDLKELGMLA